MYPGGYLKQLINQDGWQENFTRELNKDAAPINRLLDDEGGQLRVPVP